MTQELLGQIRAILSVIAGALVTKGIIDSSTAETLIAVVIGIVPMVWSWWIHRQQAKAAETQALLTHALAVEIAPAPTSKRADAIMTKMVADTAPAMPPSGTSVAKVDAAIAGAKP